MSEDEEDPLERLYGDSDSIDRDRLANALEGTIEIDRKSADPIFLEEYDDLSGKKKFVAQLLHRRAAVALGEIENGEIGLTTDEVAENIEYSKSAVHNYAADIDYVENNDEKGGYYLRDFGINKAIELISNDN